MQKRPLVKGLFYGIVLPAAIGIGAWQAWAWWSWAKSPVISASDRNDANAAVQIQIPTGTSGTQIGQDLEAAGLIRSATAWKLWSRWQAWQQPEGAFQAGTYQLSPTQTLDEIAQIIWSGDVIQTTFTIPEGWNRRQMADYFQAEGFFSADAFINASNQVPRDQFPWLPDNIPHLEGFLFPDTYQLQAEGVTPEAVVNQMLKQFEQVALPLYTPENSLNASLLEWVTLASIVEKEAVIPDERPTIAGVFANRLVEDMPLGADPTVEYGLGIRQTKEQPLTLAQVRTPNPYNTYLNQGLPPTPIASPGTASLSASLNPAKTDFLYFVARYDGTHVFSRTLADHEAAQAKIRTEVDEQRGGQ